MKPIDEPATIDVLQLGGPNWDVKVGRRAGLDDGELQRRQQQHPAAHVGPRQPHIPLFVAQGLSQKDTVALSGMNIPAHACSLQQLIPTS
jgi:hypothetical protein